MSYKNHEVGRFSEPMSGREQKSSINIDSNERPSGLNINNEERPSSLSVDNQDRPASLSVDSQERPASLSIESQDRPNSLSIDAQDRPSSLSIDNQDRPSSLSIDSQERPASVSVESQDRPSSLSIDNQDRPSSLSIDNQDRPASLSIETQERPSSLNIDTQERPSSLSVDNQDRPSSLSIDNQERPSSLSVESQERPSSLSIDNQERPSSLSIDNQDRPSSLSIEAQERPSSLSIDNQDRPSSLNIESQERPSSLSIDNQDRPASLSIDTQERPSSLSVDSQERPSSLSIDNQERPSSLNIDSQERPSSLSVDNQERPSSLSVDNQERPSSLSVDNQERPSSLSIENQFITKIDVFNPSFLGVNAIVPKDNAIIKNATLADNKSVVGQVSPLKRVVLSNATTSNNTLTWINVANGSVSISKSNVSVDTNDFQLMTDANRVPIDHSPVGDTSNGGTVSRINIGHITHNRTFLSKRALAAMSISDVSTYKNNDTDSWAALNATGLMNMASYTGGTGSIETRFVSVYGRWLDSYKEKFNPDEKIVSQFVFGLGSKFSIKFDNISISSNDDVMIPCMPVYGSVNLNTFGHNPWMDYNNENCVSFPFPSLVFPILAYNRNNTAGLLSKSSNKVLKFSNPMFRSGECNAFQSVELNSVPKSMAELVTAFPTDSQITNTQLHDTASYQTGTSYNKDIINFNKGNCKILDNGSEYITDGLEYGGRIYNGIKVINLPSCSNKTVEIVYRAQCIYAGQELNKVLAEDPFYFGGNKIYSIVPTEVYVDGVKCSKSTVNLLFYDEERFTDKARGVDINTCSYTISQKMKVYEDEFGNELWCFKVIYNSTLRLLFGFKSNTGSLIYMQNYKNSTSWLSSLASTVNIKSVTHLLNKNTESVFSVTFSVNSLDYVVTVTAAKLSMYGLSAVAISGLSDHYMVDSYIETEEELCSIPEESNCYPNSYKLLTAGPYVYPGYPTFSKPFNKDLIVSNAPHSLFSNYHTPYRPSPHQYRSENYTGVSHKAERESSVSLCYGNSAHVFIDDVILPHNVGKIFGRYSHRVFSKAHTEIKDTSVYYEPAAVLPVIFPIVMPIKNSNEMSLITAAISTEGNARSLTGINDLNIERPRINIHTEDEDGVWYNLLSKSNIHNVHAVSVLNTATMCVQNGNVRWNGVSILGTNHLKGFSGTLSLFKTKKITPSGVFESIETAKSIIGENVSDSQILNAVKSEIVNDRRILLYNGNSYLPLNTYEYSTTPSLMQKSFANFDNANADIFKIGSFVFYYTESYYQIMLDTSKETIPIHAGAGKLIQAPCLVGGSIFFAVEATTSIDIYVIKEGGASKRHFFDKTGVTNLCLYWNIAHGSCMLLYSKDNSLNELLISENSIVSLNPQSNTTVSIVRNKGESGLLPPVITVGGVAKEIVEGSASGTVELNSADILLPENQNKSFVLTGIEIVAFKVTSTPAPTAVVTLTNPYNNTVLINNRSYDSVDSGRYTWYADGSQSIAAVNYKLTLTNLTLRNISLIGYWV